MKQLQKAFVSGVAGVAMLPYVALAACNSGSGFQNPLNCGISTFAGFTESLLRTVVYIAFPVAVLFLVYSGFLFVTAQGNQEKLKTAKNNFLWTVVGVALLLGSWALALLIKGTIDPILR